MNHLIYTTAMYESANNLSTLNNGSLHAQKKKAIKRTKKNKQ